MRLKNKILNYKKQPYFFTEKINQHKTEDLEKKSRLKNNAKKNLELAHNWRRDHQPYTHKTKPVLLIFGAPESELLYSVLGCCKIRNVNCIF